MIEESVLSESKHCPMWLLMLQAVAKLVLADLSIGSAALRLRHAVTLGANALPRQVRGHGSLEPVYKMQSSAHCNLPHHHTPAR